MRRSNKALYEQIIRNVSREVKKALNESEERIYYVWYCNYEDVDTSDMTDEDINTYQCGWKCDGGPYTLEEAKIKMIEEVKYSLEDAWWFLVEDQWYQENEHEPSLDEKFEYLTSYGKFEIYNDGKNAVFQLDNYSNTVEWMILTQEEMDARDAEYWDGWDEEDDYED